MSDFAGGVLVVIGMLCIGVPCFVFPHAVQSLFVNHFKWMDPYDPFARRMESPTYLIELRIIGFCAIVVAGGLLWVIVH